MGAGGSWDLKAPGAELGAVGRAGRCLDGEQEGGKKIPAGLWKLQEFHFGGYPPKNTADMVGSAA